MKREIKQLHDQIDAIDYIVHIGNNTIIQIVAHNQKYLRRRKQAEQKLARLLNAEKAREHGTKNSR